MLYETPLPPQTLDWIAVERWALEVMGRLGLAGWRFRFSRGKRTLGYCSHTLRTISLSVHLIVRNPPEEIRDTLLHEIAHALTPGHGHDDVWKAKAIKIGARPERCGQANMPVGRWQANCGGCGHRYHRHRRPRSLRGWYCRCCGSDRGRLVWTAQ